MKRMIVLLSLIVAILGVSCAKEDPADTNTQKPQKPSTRELLEDE